MSRKILHIAVLMVVMISTMGFTITKHYCGEDLINLSVTGSADSCCDMQDRCCRDEAQTFQLDVDYAVPMVINHVDYFAIILFEIPEFLVELQNETQRLTCTANFEESPPPKDVLHFLSDIQVYRL